MRRRSRYRRGGTLLEFAVAAPLTMMLLLGLFVGGLGVFRYQQVAHLAREASRWASVHGTSYASATGQPAATAATIYQTVIAPNAVGLNLNNLTYSVTWSTSNNPTRTTVVNGNSVVVANTVTVTINYKWIPEAIFTGATFTSSSVAIMYY